MCLALDFDHEMMGVVDREEAEAYDDHPSVHEEQAKRELNIEACIEKFTSTETLGESDMWWATRQSCQCPWTELLYNIATSGINPERMTQMTQEQVLHSSGQQPTNSIFRDQNSE